LVKLYTASLKGYYSSWIKSNPGKEYNDMIKSTVDYSLLEQSREMALSMMV